MSKSAHLEGSPAPSYDSHDESESASELGMPTTIRDDGNRSQATGHSQQLSALNATSFETDLSAPLPNRYEDRSNAYAGDPKFQKYVQLVGRNLQSFDYVQEWADVTAFLTKLSRSFEIYSKFAVVPHKVTVTKRLAQCLNPALPTGVHQKTLSIYELICKQIGSNELVADLPLYALGLFPFMRNASLKAKPQLLGILEAFFVPLGPGLRPCLKSITVGVLPGLEEGSVDVTNRVVGLLDKLRDTIDEPFFFQTLFLIMITNSEQRESALKYLAQRLPVFTRQEDVAQVCGDDALLMARALAATMTDPKTLVLRAALDLVMTRFPLRTTVFKSKDLVLLMKHASEVVLKKDMSLNRRLYTWLLGPGDSEAEQATYFRQYAQTHLTDALLGSFAAMSSAPDHQHTVLRVLTGLTDKPAISQPILDSIFVPLMLLLIAERDSLPERTLPVRLASVSRMFVEMLDPFFTWSNIVNQLTDVVAESSVAPDTPRITRALQLVQFFVQTFELDDEATLQVHVPMALLSILAALEQLLRLWPSQSTMTSLSCCFARIAIELFTRIPKSLFLAADTEGPGASIVETLRVDTMFDTTRSFYRVHRQEDNIPTLSEATDSHEECLTRVEEVDRSAAQIVRGTGLLYAIIRLCKDIAAQLGHRIVASSADNGTTPTCRTGSERLAAIAMEDVCHILRTATTYSHDFLHIPELAHCTLPATEQVGGGNSERWVPVFIDIVCGSREFSAVNIALSTLLEFVARGSLTKCVLANADTLPKVVERLWDTLSPKHVSDHYQATQLLYLLRGQLDSHGVERHLAAKLASADYSLAGQNQYARELAHYAVLWHNLRLIQREAVGGWLGDKGQHDPLAFSRLLLLVIDNAALSDVALLAGGDYAAGLSRHAAARAWVDASTDEWEHIVETLVLLLAQEVHTQKQTLNIVLSVGITSQRQEYTSDLDYGLAIYYIDTIQRYLTCAGSGVIRSMLIKAPTSPAIRQACEALGVPGGGSWLQVLVLVAAEFALTDSAPSAAYMVQATEAARARAAELAAYLVAQPRVLWPPQYVASLQGRLIDSLLYCVLYRRTLVQPPLLDFFASLCRANVSSTADGATTVGSKEGLKPTPAGIAALPDLTLLSRLVLAALTMQMTMVVLSKWAKVLATITPYIQDQISAPSNSDQDLVRMLVLPCVHALRMLLSQCAEYFGRATEQHSAARHGSAGRQLYKRLLPLFVVPALPSADEPHDAMSVGVLTTLLDAFDLFLSLSLRNADRIPAEPAVARPSSRASESSVQSAVSFGALGAIPVMKFVSSIFGPDASEEPAISSEEPAGASEEPAIASDAVGFESADFGLVSTLAVMRDVWHAFDAGPAKSPAEPADAGFQLLRDFGITDSRESGDRSGGAHVQRSVHLHVSRILEHATLAHPSEVAEAMVALWACDNPQWITRLDSSIRRGTGHSSSRRHSSASSLHTSRASISASSFTHRDAATAPEDDVPAEWSWRATDLLETAAGRTPMTVLIGLLNALHIRTIDTTGAAPTSSNSLGTDGSIKAPTRFSSLDDIALTRFIELYTRHRLTARSAAPLVPHMLSMLKDYNNNAQQNKFMLPFLLRMFTELCERVASQAQTLDPLQQVYSHDLCTAYARMVDNCILIAGRSFDQTNWLRRANADAPGGLVRIVHTAESPHTLTEDDIIDHILTYIGGAVIPQFTHLVPDYERQVGIAMNLMHYAVVPAFKSHMTGGYSGPAQALTSRSQHFALILRCLNALSQQASLMKVWKREVWEFFCDAKFFPGSAPSLDHATMSPALAPHWRHLVRTLLVSEKERFAEVLGKVSSASSGPALFANREHEAQMRALSLRRLSFIVWAGAVNQYLASLPQIQEKLVDILKNAPHPAVQIEVFLCLRVLLCRVSNHHMSNFWPMLLTELMRLFHQQLNREGREEPEQANLFLAACKFLDLLFILGTDDFLVHQWIFITDTIDALHGSRSSSSALLDQLSSRLLSMPAASRGRNKSAANGAIDSDTYPTILLSDNDDPTNLVYHQMSAKGIATAKALDLDGADLQTLSGRPLKRPIIRVRSVTSIRELDAFVHNASVQAYQAAFTLAEPDSEFIEALLVSDLIFFDFGSNSSSTSSVVLAPVSGYIGEYEY